jgi:hypothetical protein
MPTRKALLIGNNTGYNAPVFLNGVDHDLRNYRSYLQSSAGGEWREDEIIILHNSNARDIKTAVTRSATDYTLVVFSGHGFYYSNHDLTYVCASDGYVSEDELNTNVNRQTLILDCCREVSDIVEGRAYSNLTGDVEKALNYGRMGDVRVINNSRIKFDDALRQSNTGKFTGYACLINQTSGDNPNSGGVFSTALINTGQRFASLDNRTGNWLQVRDAVNNTANDLTSNPFTNQRPNHKTNPLAMNLTHPFAITNQLQGW